jgi:hypothetical protein
MLRLVVAATILSIAAVAHAEPKVCAKQPKDLTPRVMSVVANNGVFAPAPGSEFPAVSADGKRMAALFVENDGAGVPITTMMIWEVAGPKEIGYEGVGGKGDDPRSAPIIAKVANRKLAGKWRPIPTYTPCDPKNASVLQMSDGLAFTLIASAGLGGRVERTVDGKDTTQMRLRFTHLGTQAGDLDSGGGGDKCGKVTSIASGFGGLKEGLAVIVPGGVLGAGCFRSLSAHEALPFQTHGDGG